MNRMVKQECVAKQGVAQKKSRMMDLDYYRAVHDLAVRIKDWRESHEDAVCSFQFDWPEGVMVICPVGDAIEAGFIKINGDAQAMLDEVLTKGNTEETAFMLRFAMEHNDLIIEQGMDGVPDDCVNEGRGHED